MRLPFLVLSLLLSLPACGTSDDATSEQSQPVTSSVVIDSSRVLTWYDFASGEPESIKLPSRLAEISGVAFSADGRLFVHGDERAIVYELDPMSGEERKRFSVGGGIVGGAMMGDFEDIAIVGDRFFMVKSNGVIVEFTEGENKAEVDYMEYETTLSAKNDVEGLCYDPATDALLLACKENPGEGFDDDVRAVYSFSLGTKQLDAKPRFLVSVGSVTKLTGEKDFKPSAIVRHPGNGNFLLLASAGNALVELSPDGTMLGAIPLPDDVHRQPEGIAVAPDGALVISDEGRGAKGRISRYEALTPALSQREREEGEGIDVRMF